MSSVTLFCTIKMSSKSLKIKKKVKNWKPKRPSLRKSANSKWRRRNSIRLRLQLTNLHRSIWKNFKAQMCSTNNTITTWMRWRAISKTRPGRIRRLRCLKLRRTKKTERKKRTRSQCCLANQSQHLYTTQTIHRGELKTQWAKKKWSTSRPVVWLTFKTIWLSNTAQSSSMKASKL